MSVSSMLPFFNSFSIAESYWLLVFLLCSFSGGGELTILALLLLVLKELEFSVDNSLLFLGLPSSDAVDVSLFIGAVSILSDMTCVTSTFRDSIVIFFSESLLSSSLFDLGLSLSLD